MMEAQLTEQEHELLALVVLHRSVGNQKAQGLLGWDEATYAQVKQGLVAKGLLASGRGRGGSIKATGLAAKVLRDDVLNGRHDLKAPEPVAYKPAGRKAQDPVADKPLGQKPTGRQAKGPKPAKPRPDKSLETWIWDAACSIRGAKDAPKYKDYILPLIFTKRLCDVFDDELDRIAAEVGSREKAFRLVKTDRKLVRFYLPLQPADPEQ